MTSLQVSLHRISLSMAKKIGNIPQKWRVLSGENEWNKLLDPLDIDLRQYIIHYGEMAQATYDTFNPNKPSEIPPMHELFSKAGLEKGNPFKYRVTKYIYATSAGCKSNRMGYVAVTTHEGKAALGRTDIVVAWRGTCLAEEWVIDSKTHLVSASNLLGVSGDPKVHQGWYSYYTSPNPTSSFNKKSARDQVVDEVKRLVEEYKKEEISITITGHSMGAAMATLNAVDIVSNKFNKACPVTAFAFGSPRVGNLNFKKVFPGLGNLHVLRVCNANDSVPHTPPDFHYVEVGKVLDIDTSKSMYLKTLGSKSCHNLEVYLHGIAGTQGSKRGFQLEVNRGIAVVNKRLDALKDEYGVPVSWWWDENKKGMVQQEDGSWKLING